MSVHPEIEDYLKDIENELTDFEKTQKQSIVQEIEEHLTEKIDDMKTATGKSDIPPKEIKKIIEDFGSPAEICEEYRRQGLDEKNKAVKKKDSRKLFIPIIALGVVISLIIVCMVFFYNESDDEKAEKKTILEGKGLDEIQIGDDLSKIVEVYGEPESRNETDTTIRLDYQGKNGMDFLLSKQTEKILEIRFNPGFHGSLQSNVTIGSQVDFVVEMNGGALKTVAASINGRNNLVYGIDRVLYEQMGENNKTTPSMFINAPEGILFWFDIDKTVSQIVVFQPYSNIDIKEGVGLYYLKIGEDLPKIIDFYGNPESRYETDTTIWIKYHEKNGMDFLLSKQTEKILEIRFNTGSTGSLESGITIGSTLDSVLIEYGSAEKTVRTNPDGVAYSVLGRNKVMYEQVDENGKITAYKFILDERGITFWFGPDKNVTQIVVKDPYQGKPDIAPTWLGVMQMGDMEERIIGWYGEPEEKVVTANMIGLAYHEVAGIDFLIDNNTKKVLEVRFNEGFDWATINQVSIGSSLNEVLNLSGGANKTVQISSNDTLNQSHGSDKVLYEIVDGGNNKVAYKFIDSKSGILVWFDRDGRSTQIVVFDPY